MDAKVFFFCHICSKQRPFSAFAEKNIRVNLIFLARLSLYLPIILFVLRLKRLLCIWLGLFCLLFVQAKANDEGVNAVPQWQGDKHLADSLMERVVSFAPFYKEMVKDYQAKLYMKGTLKVPRKNQLIRFLPTMFRMKKGVNEYLTETMGDLHYTMPDIYDYKVNAQTGTASHFWEMDGRLYDYFQINVYQPTLLKDKLISPLAPNAKEYYRFRVDTVVAKGTHVLYKIRFIPRNRSYQLVGGYLVVCDQIWTIREFCFFGRSEMIQFNNRICLGEIGSAEEFIPISYELEANFNYLGNRIDGYYEAMLKYEDVNLQMPLVRKKPKVGKDKYDLTASYTLQNDTNKVLYSYQAFDTLRLKPLSDAEKQLYEDFQQNNTLTNQQEHPRKVFWSSVGDLLTTRNTYDIGDASNIRVSPLINPFLVSYSGSRGWSYRQELRYTRTFNDDRLLRIVPRIGYNFTEKALYWRIKSDLYYWPQKNASLHVELGTGNRIYSSEVIDDLKALPDSTFDFNLIHLDYFKDLYMNIEHRWEIVNGLTLGLGVSTHQRSEVNRSRWIPINGSGTLVGIDPEVLKRFRHSYGSFAPRISLSWTPGQYYYMQGKRKVNLHSHYPTIAIDMERGLKGVFGSTGSYERIEVDLQHTIPLGGLRNIYYRLGGGAFTNQEEMYFVDFVNLKRSNLPVGWNDEIGGVFQLLDARWYNSSREYLRGHFTYEAPFIFLPHKRLTQHVLNERLYLNLLSMPRLNPYIELGYGVGTHIFDFGLFVSFANGKYQELGCKFTFELFNR